MIPCGFESRPRHHQLVLELPLKLLKSRAKRVICSFAANLDFVRGFYCSPRSGGVCWYIVELLFLVPTFSFSQCIRFFISKLSFFRGLIILVPRVDAHLILISHLHSSAGDAPSQGHPKFPQGFVFLVSYTCLYFRKKYHEKKR